MTDHSCGAPHHHCGTSHDQGAGSNGPDAGSHDQHHEGGNDAWMLTALALTTLASDGAEPARSTESYQAVARKGSGALAGWVLWVLAALVFAATWFAVS